jgi:hypothetical protein
MEKIWKTREKQLEKILLNTNGFIGSIKGIAGSSLPELPTELPTIENNNEKSMQPVFAQF